MKLTVKFQPTDSWLEDRTYEIGDGKEFKTWYWSTTPSLMDMGSVANLIIKRWCHAGCRVEISRERINSIEVETNEHEASKDEDSLEGYSRRQIVCDPCKHACP